MNLLIWFLIAGDEKNRLERAFPDQHDERPGRNATDEGTLDG
jgi:hypothetical protein